MAVRRIFERIPTGVYQRLRAATRGPSLLCRRVRYAIRFAGMNVTVHPTTWVAGHAIIRCTDGGRIVIGKYCEIHDYAIIDSNGGSVQIGDHCSVNPFAILYGHGGTFLGNGVRIAAQTVIIPANHNFRSSTPLHEAGVVGRGIAIGNDVWVGAGARILDGVVIGDRSVVGAGAVVSRSVPTGSVATGVPARFRAYQGASQRT